jgi:hypothetical protein
VDAWRQRRILELAQQLRLDGRQFVELPIIEKAD